MPRNAVKEIGRLRSSSFRIQLFARILVARIDRKDADDSAAGSQEYRFCHDLHGAGGVRVTAGIRQFRARIACWRAGSSRCARPGRRTVPLRRQLTERLRLQWTRPVFLPAGRGDHPTDYRAIVVNCATGQQHRTAQRRPAVLSHRRQDVARRFVRRGKALRTCATIGKVRIGRVPRRAVLSTRAHWCGPDLLSDERAQLRRQALAGLGLRTRN